MFFENFDVTMGYTNLLLKCTPYRQCWQNKHMYFNRSLFSKRPPFNYRKLITDDDDDDERLH